jgi:hypothetical protein
VGTKQTFLDKFAGGHAALSPEARLAPLLIVTVARVTLVKQRHQVRTGSIASVWPRVGYFRSTLVSRPFQTRAVRRIRANNGQRLKDQLSRRRSFLILAEPPHNRGSCVAPLPRATSSVSAVHHAGVACPVASCIRIVSKSTETVEIDQGRLSPIRPHPARGG